MSLTKEGLADLQSKAGMMSVSSEVDIFKDAMDECMHDRKMIDHPTTQKSMINILNREIIVDIPQKYIISYRSPFLTYWDIFILLCAAYNSFMIPFDIPVKPEWRNTNTLIAIDVIIELLFVADIIIMFLSSYMDKMGHEECRIIQIAKNYISMPKFYIDVLSLLGNGIFTNMFAWFQLFGYLKIVRVTRLNAIIAKMKIAK